MTNWMTAAGLALIAGGLATLITFWSVIFGGEARRAARTGSAPRRRRRARERRRAAAVPTAATAQPAQAAAPRETAPAGAAPGDPASAGMAPGAAPHEMAAAGMAPRAGLGTTSPGDEEQGAANESRPAVEAPGGAVLTYDDYEPPEDEEPDPEATDPEYEDEPGYDESSTSARAAEPVRRHWDLLDTGVRDSYRDRVGDWIRPRYQELNDRPVAGEYWTPVPHDLYAEPEPPVGGYDWPVPAERLPPIPSYEPATGFDLPSVQAADPAGFVSRTWPPDPGEHRPRQPRSWRDRDEKRSPPLHTMSAQPRDPDDKRPWRDQDERRDPRARHERPRPRPRPAGQVSGYVSRHAAGPHP